MSESPLLERLELALREAMKARAPVRLTTLRLVRSALQNRRIEKRADLDEADALQVLTTQAKQRRESIEQFRAGGRQDLVEKEEAELAVLREFLPEELSEAELRALILEVKGTIGASDVKDMGRLMGALMPRVRGRADGSRVNALVRQILAGGESS